MRWCAHGCATRKRKRATAHTVTRDAQPGAIYRNARIAASSLRLCWRPSRSRYFRHSASPPSLPTTLPSPLHFSTLSTYLPLFFNLRQPRPVPSRPHLFSSILLSLSLSPSPPTLPSDVSIRPIPITANVLEVTNTLSSTAALVGTKRDARKLRRR